MRLSPRGVTFVGLVLACGCGSQTIHVGRPPGVDAGDAAAPNDGASSEAATVDVAPHDAVASPDVARTPRGDTCDDAIPVAVIGRLTIEPPERTEAPLVVESPFLQGRRYVRWFRVEVPTQAVVEARAEAPRSGFPYTIVGFTRCAADAWETHPRNDGAVYTWPNTADRPRALYLAVAAAAPVAAEATVRLSARPVAPNGRCATATPVSDGTRLTGEDITVAGEFVGACGPPTPQLGMRPALHYRAHVRTGETLFASHRSDPTQAEPFIGYLHVRDACGDSPCLAQSRWSLERWRRIGVVWTNDGPARDVLVTTQGLSGLEARDTATTFRIVGPASNTRCEAATPLPSGVPRDTNLVSAPRAPLPCGPGETRQTAFYTVRVPASSTLTVSATPLEGTADEVRVLLSDGCGRPTCLAQGQSADQPTATASYTTGAEAVTVTVAVTGVTPDGRSPFLARVLARVRP